jgi:hypothetical protein
MPASAARIVILVVTVAAIVILILATGWADDKAQPGTGGRAPVTNSSADDSR